MTMARKKTKGRPSPHTYISLRQLNLKEKLAIKDFDLKRAEREIKDLRNTIRTGKVKRFSNRR
jgi:hypothetical protein